MRAPWPVAPAAPSSTVPRKLRSACCFFGHGPFCDACRRLLKHPALSRALQLRPLVVSRECRAPAARPRRRSRRRRRHCHHQQSMAPATPEPSPARTMIASEPSFLHLTSRETRFTRPLYACSGQHQHGRSFLVGLAPARGFAHCRYSQPSQLRRRLRRRRSRARCQTLPPLFFRVSADTTFQSSPSNVSRDRSPELPRTAECASATARSHAAEALTTQSRWRGETGPPKADVASCERFILLWIPKTHCQWPYQVSPLHPLRVLRVHNFLLTISPPSSCLDWLSSSCPRETLSAFLPCLSSRELRA